MEMDERLLIHFTEYFVSTKRLFRYIGVKDADTIDRLGEYLGVEISKTLNSTNLLDLLDELQKFWEIHGLGELKIVSTNPLTFTIKDCCKCYALPDEALQALCAFNEKIIETILKVRLGRRTKSKKISSFSSGECIFEVWVI